MDSSNLLILGGRSLVAPYLIARLAEKGLGATVASRQPLVLPSGFAPLRLDLEASNGWQAPEGATILSLLPIWALAASLPLFDKVKNVIAVSSTSRFGKATSDDPKELATAQKIVEGEEKIEAWARNKDIAFTILRPTLIYDGKNDVNVTRIAATIRRFGTFPVAAPAQGLRQPIHADDVAGAIIGALNNPSAENRAFNIAGGEILTYREMVERVAVEVKKCVIPATAYATLRRVQAPSRAVALERRRKAGIQGHKKSVWVPCPLLLPVWLLKTAFRLVSATGLLREKHFGFAVFQRMNEDLIFDVEEGLKLLDYRPRRFTPSLNPDL